MPEHLRRRGGFWYSVRRVPKEYAELDRRVIVQQTTGIRVADDPRAIRAKPAADRLNKDLEQQWRRLATGEDTRQAEIDYRAARAAAKRMNISPPIDDPTSRTIAELMERIRKLEALNLTHDRGAVLAVYDAAPAPAVTFKECAEQYIEAHKPSWSSAKHTAQWSTTLADYAYPVIGDQPVSKISNSVGTDLVMKVLEPIWYSKTDTANRVRGRIESVLDWAKVRGYREGENPARWRGHLDKLLPARSKVRKVEHHAALPYTELPAFMARLREQSGTAARAFEFIVLTAARASEVLLARRSEIDLDARMWTVPAERMKARKEHRVPLSDSAIAIAKATAGSGFIFPGAKKGRPLSDKSLRNLLDRMGIRYQVTTHGMRSTFRDWGAEMTHYANELLEMAIAHAIDSKTESAYRRGDLLGKRHKLMADWAAFCSRG